MSKRELLGREAAKIAAETSPAMTQHRDQPKLIRHLFLVLSALGIAACGGGGSGTSPREAPQPATPPAGSGTVRVEVTDYFGTPVAGARVAWLGFPVVEAISDETGKALLENVPSGTARVCAHHAVRGDDCDQDHPVTLQADAVVDLARQLRPDSGPPLAAVLGASLDRDGLSPDGRTIDVTIRVAVTQRPARGSWFSNVHPPGVADCVARDGTELAEHGPRCIVGPDGTDTSYTFGGLTGSPAPKVLEQPFRPATVGLLVDQSAPLWTEEDKQIEARVYAAKIFADRALPDIGLLLAGFAGDDPLGGNPSRLPQQPVTFLPLTHPGPFLSKPEAFAELDGFFDLSGGIAPLYTAVSTAIDFVADQALPGTRRLLVVMANGRDDSCATHAECAALRAEISAKASTKDVELILLATEATGTWFRPEEAIWALAVDAAAPLPAGLRGYHGALELVQQLLAETVPVEDVRVRLTSNVPGAFRPGAVVAGELVGYTDSNCPFDCYEYVLPISVRIP